nr:integrase, catalytic region, zinc finger, CCHC-type, peptidase aspartic, catalytic [Tanacetum cinerariifolium]
YNGLLYEERHYTEGQGAAAVQVTIDKMDEEFTEIKNNRELADIQATNILSQGLPRHVFNILDIPTHQMNTKFVNNLPPYWVKYVTNVKNNKDISATTYVELYTYLKSYEPHALKTLKKQEQSSRIVDPLAYLASTTHHLTPTQPTNLSPSTSSLTLPSQPAAQSSNDAMLANMNQIVNLLSGFQKQFPPTNNQLRTSSNSRSHATVHDGQIVTKTVQRKALGNVGNTGTRGTQSYGQVTDNNEKLVICYNCRGEGHVLRQCKEKKRVKDSQYFKDKMLLMEAKVKRAVLDAKAEAFLADVECTAPYDQPIATTTTNIFEVIHEDTYDFDVDEGPHAASAFMANLSSTSGTNGATTSHVNEQLDCEVQDVPTEVSSVSPGEISIITILDDLRNQLDGHLKAKIAQPTLYDGHALLKPTNTPVRVHDSEESLVHVEVSRTKMSNRPGTIKPISYAELNALYSHFVPRKKLSREQLDKEYKQCVLEKKKLQIENKNLLIQNECLITDCIAKDICSIVLSSDRDRPLSEELRSNCVRENSKVIEFEAEILKQQQMLAELDKRFNAVFEINQLKEQLQGKDDTIRKLQTQSNIMSMLNVELTVENVNMKRRYQELSTSNSHSLDTLTRKLTALTAENAKLKSELLSKMHSEPIVPEKPKVLAPGIPSNRPTRKTKVQQNKKPNIHVNLSTRVKPVTGASKPISKSDTRNHSILPAKREKEKRVEDHHMNLNKQNHVDSHLNVKRTGFVLNLNTVFNECNESLFFANHDNCVVRNLKSVNLKTPTTKHNVKTTKKVWKAKVVTVRFTDYKLSNRKAGSKGISGCSRRMTGDRSKLTNYVDKFIGTVRFENDQFAVIVGYGDYKLGNTIISRVYYVEGLSHNLFSVRQFCDGGLEVAFRQHTCHIRNNDMVDLLQGLRTTNLYSISLNDMLASSPVCLLTKASSTKSWLWHRRLNHLNFGTLNELARNDLMRGLTKGTLRYSTPTAWSNSNVSRNFEGTTRVNQRVT